MGVIKIRSLINDGKGNRIDVKQLLSHVFAFSFFLVSVVVEYTFYMLTKIHNTKQAEDNYQVATMASIIISFCAQLV